MKIENVVWNPPPTESESTDSQASSESNSSEVQTVKMSDIAPGCEVFIEVGDGTEANKGYLIVKVGGKEEKEDLGKVLAEG